MNKFISLKLYNNYATVAYFENNEVKIVDDIEIEGESRSYSIEKAIETFARNHGIRICKISFNMRDDECIIQNVVKKKNEVTDYLMNLSDQFSDFIDDEEALDYVFDYQYVEEGPDEMRMFIVAAKKYDIESYVEIATRIGTRIDILRPETASIGNVLKLHNIEGAIVIDIGQDEIVVRVYKGRQLLATNVIEEGTAEVIEMKKNNPKGAAKTEQYKRVIGRIVTAIAKTIAYYDEAGISDKSYKLIFIGEGASVVQITKSIEGLGIHKSIHAKELVRGRCSNTEAQKIFSMTGLMY